MIARDRKSKFSAKGGQRAGILRAGAERGASGCAMPRTWQPPGGKVSGKRSAAAAMSAGGGLGPISANLP